MSVPLSASLRGVQVVRRGKTILGPLDLDLDPAGFTMVLGPNGAGKTTLLKVLHGIERVSAGSLRWSAPDAEVRQAQAYVFQSPVMLRRSVRGNLSYPLRLTGMKRAQVATRVDRWLDRIGLGGMADRPATRLSGGERQKLALGRALIRAPRILFLDEPCANLDGRSTREIETLLRDTHRAGTRIVMTTHDIGQARRLASDVVFLLRGRLHEHGPATPFFAAAQTDEANSFLKGDIVE